MSLTDPRLGRARPAAFDDDRIELTGGTWRPVGGILRWVADEIPKAVTYDPKAIACPRCRARADQGCRTRNGHQTKSHPGRIIPRCCPCGAPVGPKRQKCDDCLVHVQRVGQRKRRLQEAAAEWEAA